MKKDFANIAREAASAGSEILLKYWQNLDQEDADTKARNDWVSKADRESEAAIIDVISGHSPNDSFLGEEGGHHENGSSSLTWIIDPLDGTSNYLRHFPFWSISIALRDGDEMVGGLVFEPLHDEWFVAEKGAGAWRNGGRVTISDQETLEGAYIATGFPFRAQEYVDDYMYVFKDVVVTAKGVRRAGSAALDLAYTSAGIFDGFFELHLAPWDIAAGALLVLEAGGQVSDFSGGERFWERGNIIGAAPGVHRDLLEVIGRHTSEDQLGP
ncbi:MAG: inositol monophosphatase family protein [Thermoanaerobaculia bacterium]|nr:inositol monophosphatase family protein [Thermoanaerobaculia bacterium]